MFKKPVLYCIIALLVAEKQFFLNRGISGPISWCIYINTFLQNRFLKANLRAFTPTKSSCVHIEAIKFSRKHVYFLF